MWIQKILLFVSSTAVLCRPVPTPTPISVYQQSNGEEQQEYQQQYRQPIQYKQQLVQQVRPAGRALYKSQGQNPRLLQQETESEDYEMSPPQPYQFSFDVNDDENTNYQNRKEQREGNKISGSYSVVDSDGFIRTVTYTADPVEGFKAHVSREPTNIVVKVPTPNPSVEGSQANLYTASPKVQYSPAPAKQVGIQYNGAPVPRQPIARPQQIVDAVPRRQQTQQYLQGTQDLIQYQPIYQTQGNLRHSQAISTAGQINQFLAETSPQAAQNQHHLIMANGKTASSVLDWTDDEISEWLQSIDLLEYCGLFKEHSIDGSALLFMTENDLRNPPLSIKRLGDIKKLYHEIHILQLDNIPLIAKLGYDPCYVINNVPHDCRHDLGHYFCQTEHITSDIYPLGMDIDDRAENSGRSKKLKPEVWKTVISLLYLFIVTWITAFVMVIVHNRVPDMKKYPPLPDIFLDNVPHIPWAFAMCEFTGTLMLIIWIAVLIFHKHRFILLRRFFALSGTVFLLRCVTMLITSLSVPGTHLQCNPMVEELQLDNGSYHSIWIKARHAYFIWRGAGMSIQGVRTCGDYMFSGHTAALTILNFFITEYTPRNLYFMHTFSWILNMFGIFFILSAHEHYSIDVFIAFYITSRLFLYYHTLANNQALMQRDSNRTRIWFPLFSFFESEVDGIVPNEFETPTMLAHNFIRWLKTRWKICYRLSMRREMTPVPEKSNNIENNHRRYFRHRHQKES